MTDRRPNPYPGPRPFMRGEKLYGRQRETAELLDLLIAERIVLLYSPSGAGKTSLVQAALIPALEDEGFRVLPVMRPGLSPESEEQSVQPANRYVVSSLIALEADRPEAERSPLAALGRMTLAGYLDALPAPAGDDWHGDVLVFDQFEEVLTFDPTDRAAKLAFFEQIGSALRDRNRWALFAMREEYIAALDPYLRPIPARFDKGHRYRLDLLGPDSAREAMQGPPADQMPQVIFSDPAADRLVDDLRRAQVQQPDGSMHTTLGQHIEPVQLQVVCRRLWDNLSPDDRVIDVDDLAAVGEVDDALRGYYADTIASAAATMNLSERGIRTWLDRQLITEAGVRSQVLKGLRRSPEGDAGLDNAAIRLLENAHLVRSEQRRGATWFELAHDRLIAPVRADNQAWFEVHLSTLQRQAALWEEEKRPDGLLLGGASLAEAEAWADAHPDKIELHERAFLVACREEQARVERAQRQSRRVRALAVAAYLIGSLALIAAVVALAQRARAKTAEAAAEQARTTAMAEASRALSAEATAVAERDRAEASAAEAQRQASRARSGDIIARMLPNLDSDLDLALLLSVQANRVERTQSARYGLLTTLGHVPERVVAIMRGHSGEVVDIAASADGCWLVTLGADGQVIVWDAESRQRLHQRDDEAGQIVALDISPDSSVLVAGHEDGRISTWTLPDLQWAPELSTGEAFPERPSVDPVAVSPDGRIRASAAGYSDSDYSVVLSDADTGLPIAPPLTTEYFGNTHALAFSADGQRLFAGGASSRYGWDDGIVLVWDVGAAPGPDRSILTDGSGAGWVTLSPDGGVVALALRDGGIVIWDAEKGEPIGDPLPAPGDSSPSLDFSPDGQLLAASSHEGNTVRVWDLATREELGAPLRIDSPFMARFSPDSGTLAACGYKEIRVWDVPSLSERFPPLVGHDNNIFSFAYRLDGRVLVSGGSDNRIIEWDLTTGQPVGEPIVRSSGGRMGDIALSPNGRWLAAGVSRGDDAVIWDMETHQRADQLHVPDNAFGSLEFTPDGGLLVVGMADGSLTLWDTETFLMVRSPVAAHADIVRDVAISSDSRWLASAGDDGNVHLWDLSRMETTMDAWLARACRVANRNLTQQEWQQFVGASTPYEATCPEFPAGR